MNELLPFHLSIFCHTLEEARSFYVGLLGCEEKRATATSVHFDFFGSQLTLHALGADYSPKNIHRKVDAEDVPVPHFGAALTVEEFHRVAGKLRSVDYPCVLEPHIRFVGKPHEQWIVFILDPGDNAIEIKAFTKIVKGVWV
jgi:extradiol dioxygenase family protein